MRGPRGKTPATEGTPIRFRNAAAFRNWLREHHRSATSLVLRVARNHAASLGVTYAEALDEALCYGWIDGVRRSIDADSFSVRFSPRKPRSIWSLVNVRHARRLIGEGRMTDAGLAAFHAREGRRTGVYSFERARARLTPRFLSTFRAAKRAWVYFQREAPWYRRTSTFWVMSAKREETRVKRLAILIESSANGERIGPLQRAPAASSGPDATGAASGARRSRDRRRRAR